MQLQPRTTTEAKEILHHIMKVVQTNTTCTSVVLVLFTPGQKLPQIQTCLSINHTCEVFSHSALVGATVQLVEPKKNGLARSNAFADLLNQELNLANHILVDVPLETAGQCFGTLIFQCPALEESRESDAFFRSLARLASTALNNSVVETNWEFQRIANQLHDTVCQTLYAAHAFADLLNHTIEDRSEQTVQYLNEVVMLTQEAIEEAQTIIKQLRPEKIGSEHDEKQKVRSPKTRSNTRDTG